MENTIFYILIFIMGTVFGSFSTLAVYRLPLHQDITHKRSYCPSCNHKLGFLDMIPVLSYIFLRGKCRYCGKKIRIRYLLLEVLTGTIFLLFAISIKMNILDLRFDISKSAYLIFGLLYLAGIVIIAGIDKENRKINKPVLVYEVVILSIYMIYLYIVEQTNIHRYVIYLMILLLMFIIDTVTLKKNNKENYLIEVLILAIIQATFSNSYVFVLTTILMLIAIVFEKIIRKITKKDDEFYSNLKIGFYLCVSNIITLLLTNFLACYVVLK